MKLLVTSGAFYKILKMAKIQWPIPISKSERVRDRIALILADELEYQASCYYVPEAESTVFIERSMPMDKIEMPAVNVCCVKGSFDNKNQGSVDGMWEYAIFGQYSSPSTDDDHGDKLAMIKLQRLMGAIKYILEDPIYKTLGFTAPFLSTSIVGEIIYSGAEKKDGLSTVFARLTYQVKLPESNKLLQGTVSNEYVTTATIGTTGEGYLYVDLSGGDFNSEDFNDDFNI